MPYLLAQAFSEKSSERTISFMIARRSSRESFIGAPSTERGENARWRVGSSEKAAPRLGGCREPQCAGGTIRVIVVGSSGVVDGISTACARAPLEQEQLRAQHRQVEQLNATL